MSGDNSARLGLPYLAAGQMQKHVTLNEVLTRLDALVAPTVVSRTTTAQPVSPLDGSLYIRPLGATGSAWSVAAAGDVLRAEAGGWSVIQVAPGTLVYIIDENQVVVREAGGWTPLGARLGEVQGINRLGLNTTADATNAFAAKLDKALWTARDDADGGGDLRFTFNKTGPSAVLSLLMQSAYGGRAELGLVGSDDLSLRVSADGSTWSDVFTVERATGAANFTRGTLRVATEHFSANGVYTPPAWARLVQITACGGGGGGGSGATGTIGTARFGGGGAGAGGRADGEWLIDALAPSLVITIGAGGAGGAAVSGISPGTAGVDGGTTEVKSDGVAILVVGGGLRGNGGSTASGSGGAGGAGTTRGNIGGGSSTVTTGTKGDQATRGDAAGGGGGGGGFDAAGNSRAGGGGGVGNAVGDGSARGMAGAGGGVGAAGQAGAAPADSDLAWMGGGGGGGGALSSGAGGSGGAGSPGGAGGGGGGAGLDTASSGAGGAGGVGYVRITAIG